MNDIHLPFKRRVRGLEREVHYSTHNFEILEVCGIEHSSLKQLSLQRFDLCTFIARSLEEPTLDLGLQETRTD